jgi:Protein of unknown function (DUF5672)
MLDLSNITLAAVTSVSIKETIDALVFSSRKIKFKTIKLITSEDVQDVPDNIIVEKIPYKLDYIEYSKFIVYELHKFIDTEHTILIQYDGFIVNPDGWRDEFLKYDYIGAPWGLPTDDFSYRDPFGNIIRVGNGGFTLRSKRLLELPSKLNLEWKSYFGYYNEDGFLTCHNRHLLEKEGCVYAPLDTAIYFSHETNIPEINGIIPFGFHGKGSIYYNLFQQYILKQRKINKTNEL